MKRSDAFGAFRDRVGLERTPEGLEKLLRGIGAARCANQLTADQMLIFLAAGYLGLAFAGDAVKVTRVSCSDIASLLQIPRETVRRKAGRFVELQLISMTSNGIIIENVAEWRRFANSVI